MMKETISELFRPADPKKNSRKLKADDVMYYWDHGFLRKRFIYSVNIIDTGELDREDKCKLRSLLKRSNLPRFVYDVKFLHGGDKNILMVPTSNKGQWSTGTMYYWDNIDDWAFHQDVREILMNEKIDRALADIAYARKQLESISSKFRTVRKTILL